MIKAFAITSGIVLFALGLFGFATNPFIGAAGFFVTNGLMNTVYLASGTILMLAGLASPLRAVLWMILAGTVYLMLAVAGFITIPSGGNLLQILTVSSNSNWLHLIVGIVLIFTGLSSNDQAILMPISPRTT